MKTISTLSVESFDYDTFEQLPGYDKFEEKYKLYEREYRTIFYFDCVKKETIDEAKNLLEDLKLAYKQYFSVELETDDELKNYPIVAIVFNTTKFPIVLETKGKLTIGSKVSKRNFHNCIGTRKQVFSEKAKVFFEKNIEHIHFTTVFNEKGTQKYYIIENLKQLQNPRIYPEYTSVEAYKDDMFHIENTDGRFDYSEDALQEIEQHTFLMENAFIHQGKHYKSPYESYVCSGEFAYELKKHFNLKEDVTTFYIPTLKYV